MFSFLLDPVIIIVVVISVIALLIFWRVRGSGDDNSRLNQSTPIFVFPRTGGFMELLAKTFDGLVTYGTGGFVEDAKAVVPMFYGRVAWLGGKNPNAARKRVNIYITRPGDAGPLNFANESMAPENIARERFDAYSAISVEREINRGKLDAGKALFSENLLAIAAFVAIFMVIVTWTIVLILPLTNLPVKSASDAQATPVITGTPTFPIPVTPTATAFVPPFQRTN